VVAFSKKDRGIANVADMHGSIGIHQLRETVIADLQHPSLLFVAEDYEHGSRGLTIPVSAQAREFFLRACIRDTFKFCFCIRAIKLTVPNCLYKIVCDPLCALIARKATRYAFAFIPEYFSYVGGRTHRHATEIKSYGTLICRHQPTRRNQRRKG